MWYCTVKQVVYQYLISSGLNKIVRLRNIYAQFSNSFIFLSKQNRKKNEFFENDFCYYIFNPLKRYVLCKDNLILKIRNINILNILIFTFSIFSNCSVYQYFEISDLFYFPFKLKVVGLDTKLQSSQKCRTSNV